MSITQCLKEAAHARPLRKSQIDSLIAVNNHPKMSRQMLLLAMAQDTAVTLTPWSPKSPWTAGPTS